MLVAKLHERAYREYSYYKNKKEIIHTTHRRILSSLKIIFIDKKIDFKYID